MNKFFLVAALGLLIGCNSSSEKDTPSESDTPSIETVTPTYYEILKLEDVSSKGKSLANNDIKEGKSDDSSYVKRVRGKVFLNNSVTNENLKSIFEELVSEITEEDPEIDELILYLYSDVELQNKNHDLGIVLWAPFGKLGMIHPNNKSNNLRDKHEISYNLYVDDLEAYLKSKDTDPAL